MRVVCLNPFLPPPLGGIEKEMIALSEQFVAMGHRVTVVSTTARFPDGWNETAPDLPDGIDVVRLPGAIRTTLRGFSPSNGPLRIPGLEEAVVGLEPGLVLVFNIGWPIALRGLLKRLRGTVPVLYRTYFHPPGGILRNAKRHLLLNTVAIADLALVATERERRELITSGHLDPEQIRVIPPGVNVYPEDAERPPGLGEETDDVIRIAHVGRLSAFKGTLDLIEVLPLVRSMTGRNVELVLIGAEQAGQDLSGAVSRLGMQSHVEFTGEVHDDHELRRLLRQADIFALPSEYEAYGIAYIEGLAAGLPCVGCDVGGVREAIGTNGILIDTFGDREALASALVSLVVDDELRRALGHAGQDRVLGSLTWRHTAERFLAASRSLEVD